MANKTTFVVQTFDRKRGRLVPTMRDLAPTSGGALKRAEAVAARLPGAAALQVDADNDTGEVASIKVLGEFGEVPDDFKDSLQGG